MKVQNAVLGCNLKNDRVISVHFQGKLFNITVIQVYAPTTNTEEVEDDLLDPDNHDGVTTHPEPDILECTVKWALGSITMNKVSGDDEISAKLFQILKDDTVKVLQSMCQQIWKTQQWPKDWKRSIFIPIPKKGNAKECSNYLTIAPISLAK